MFSRWIDIPDDKSVLLIGPRRSGKTTLLRSRFPDYKYVTLDDLDILDWASKDPKGLISSLGRFAIIDEIQRKPALTVAVKYAIDNENSRFIMTGSSSMGLLNSAADTLAGRIYIKYLPTACAGENKGKPGHSLFDEELDFQQLRENERELQNLLKFGLFPEILEEKEPERKSVLLQSYRDSYFTRDLMQISSLENLEGLLAIFQHLSRSIGSHLEVSNFARESGLSHPTTKKYLNTLHQAQLSSRLYGYQFGPAKRHIKAHKTYYADNGIIKSLNVSLSEGQILENFVISEIEKRRKLGFIRCDALYYYKTIAGREIDVVFEQDGEVYAIEIKNTRNPSGRDIRNLREFGEAIDRKTNLFLFYRGDNYETLDSVRMIPISALIGGV